MFWLNLLTYDKSSPTWKSLGVVLKGWPHRTISPTTSLFFRAPRWPPLEPWRGKQQISHDFATWGTQQISCVSDHDVSAQISGKQLMFEDKLCRQLVFGATAQRVSSQVPKGDNMLLLRWISSVVWKSMRSSIFPANWRISHRISGILLLQVIGYHPPNSAH